MCGRTGASSSVTVPGHSPQALGVDATLHAALEEHLHADADAQDRAAAREPAFDSSSPPLARSASMHGAERTDAGNDEAVRLEDERAVGGQPRIAPAASRALTAEWTLPDP